MMEWIKNVWLQDAASISVAQLLDPVWKCSVLMVLVWMLAVGLKRCSASLRHVIWVAGMLGVLVLPWLSWTLPKRALPVLSPEVELATREYLGLAPIHSSDFPVLQGTTEVPMSAVAGPVLVPQRGQVTPATTPSRVPSPGALPLQAAMAVLWMLGSSLVILSVLVSQWRSAKWVRRARAAGAGFVSGMLPEQITSLRMPRPVDVVLSDMVHMPMVTGLISATVLLPAAARDWDEEKRRSVLLHELAHVKRRDCATQFLARLALALHWFNPLVWYANRRMLVEREKACDDLVLRAGTDAPNYADLLLAVAREERSSSSPFLSALAMARPSQLEGRLLAILDGDRRRSPLTRLGASVAMLTMALCVVPLAMMQLTAAESLAQEPVQAATDRNEPAIVLRVSADGTEAYATIQAAVEAAPEGATVQVLPGDYYEQVVIDKFLTLQGAGFEATRIIAGDETQHALEVRDTSGVLVKGLRLSSQGTHRDGSIGSGAIVLVKASELRMEACAIVDGPHNGMVIEPGSTLELEGSLVGAVWSEGIVLKSGATATIRGSEIRNCYHYGILLGSGSHGTIQSCRISGSAWHGIRYDNCSPTIRGNLIFDNERTGIYAVGDGQAVVQQNLFLRNGFAGISRIKGGRDLIENNTFARNGRAGLEISGGQGHTLRKNLFFANPTGSSGSPEFEESYFWKNERDYKRWKNNETAFFEELGNRVLDPLFVDAPNHNYSLRAESTALLDGVGVAVPLAMASPWPRLPADSPFDKMVAEKLALASAPSLTKAYALAKPWVEGVLQIEDAGRRAVALNEIRAALESEVEEVRFAGLVAFLGAGEANFDKPSFRDLILPNVHSRHGVIQVKAYYALYNSKRETSDLQLLLAAARRDAPGLKDSISHLLMMYTDGQLEGPASDVLVELMKTDNPQALRELMRGIWGAKVSPALEQRLIEISKTSLRHDAIYFGLSTLQEKSAAVLEELFLAAQDPDPNIWARALWGLGHGVPEENLPMVASFALKFFAARGSQISREEALGLMERYCGPEQVAEIEALAQNDLLPEKIRVRLQELASSHKGK